MDGKMFIGLTNLKSVGLESNECIDEVFNDQSEITLKQSLTAASSTKKKAVRVKMQSALSQKSTRIRKQTTTQD